MIKAAPPSSLLDFSSTLVRALFYISILLLLGKHKITIIHCTISIASRVVW